MAKRKYMTKKQSKLNKERRKMKKEKENKKLDKRDVAVFVLDSPEIIGELETKYSGPIKQGMWILTKEAIEKYCIQPAMKGRKNNKYLTLKALPVSYTHLTLPTN